jgi:hypothetical protein
MSKTERMIVSVGSVSLHYTVSRKYSNVNEKLVQEISEFKAYFDKI